MALNVPADSYVGVGNTNTERFDYVAALLYGTVTGLPEMLELTKSV